MRAYPETTLALQSEKYLSLISVLQYFLPVKGSSNLVTKTQRETGSVSMEGNGKPPQEVRNGEII